MIKYFSLSNNYYLNKFFQKIILKKKNFNKLLLKLYNIKKLKIKNKFFQKKYIRYEKSIIFFIIDIIFSKSNIFLNVIDSQGTGKFSYSSGNLFYKGKNKQSKILVIKSMLKILMTKLKFLCDQPVALHLKNVKFMKRWIISKFKKIFFVKIVKNFNFYSFNGCRLIKLKHKK